MGGLSALPTQPFLPPICSYPPLFPQAYLNQLAAQTPGQNGRTPHPPPARPWETNNNNTSSAAAAAPAPVTNRSAAEALRERLKLGAKRKAEDTPPPSTAKDAEGEVNGEGGPEGAKKLRTEAGAVKENPEAYWSRLSAIPGLGGEGPPGLGPDVAADQPMDAAAAAAAKEEEEEDVPEPTLPEEDLEEGLKEVVRRGQAGRGIMKENPMFSDVLDI